MKNIFPVCLPLRQAWAESNKVIYYLNQFYVSCNLEKPDISWSIFRNSSILYPLSNFPLSIKISIWDLFWQRALKESLNHSILILTDLDNWCCGSFSPTDHTFPLKNKMHLIQSAFCLREIQSLNLYKLFSMNLSKSLFKMLSLPKSTNNNILWYGFLLN